MKCLTFIFFFVGGTAAAQQIDIQQFLEVEWEASSTQETELANEISDLYVTLYNTGNLPTRTVPLGDFGTPLEALTATGAYFTPRILPPALDGLLCDLNPDHCSRDLRPVSQISLDAYDRHIGGYAASATRWTVGPDDMIVFPFVEFEQTTRLDRVQQPKGWSANDYVAAANVDCSQWDTTCEEIVRQFNPYTIPRQGGLVEATVPTLGLTANLRLRADNMGQISGALGEGFETLPAEAQVRTYVDPLPKASTEWQREFNSTSQLDMAIQGLSEDLSPIGTIREFSGDDTEPFFERQTELFMLVNHPFGKGMSLGPVHQEPIGVIVIDGKVDKRHCDWPKVLFPDGSEMPADYAEPDLSAGTEGTISDAIDNLACTEVFDQAHSSTDHATHVAGLIAAQLNGKGMVGLNPYAKLSFLHYDRGLAATEQLSDLRDKMFAVIPRSEARVANMSFGLDRRVGSSKKIEYLLSLFEGSVLFVVAAGNDGLLMDEKEFNCHEYPACLSHLENVITVVGIDRDAQNPAPWSGAGEASNTGPKFQIAAVAEDVFSTVSANRYGYKSGTSQAAPQVAAAASLIFSAGETTFPTPTTPTTPKIVKDRLRYTADIVPELLDDLSGGRLNIERAIDVANARFELFDDRIIIGQIEDAPWDFQCATPNALDRDRSLSATRRMVWNDIRQQYEIFHNITNGTNRGNRFAELKRFSSCTLASRTSKFYVRVRNNPDDEGHLEIFSFSEIRDYTSRLFD